MLARRIAPRIETVALVWQYGLVADPDWYRRQNPAYFFGPEVPVLQKRHGLKVVPYTINDEAIMQRLVDLGVDGLISDDPDLAVLVARRNGLR